MATCQYGDQMVDCSFAEKYIFPIYNGLDQSALASWVKDSLFVVPWAGALHLLAIGLLGGAVLMVDMRILGGGLTSTSPRDLNRIVRPMMISAIVLAVVSGAILALGELMKLYYSPPYWMKMASLAAAILFTFGVRNRAIEADGRLGNLTWLFAGVSLVLWTGAFMTLSNDLARWALFLLLLIVTGFAWLGRDSAGVLNSVSLRLKLMSATSIVMWLTTAAAGRWIAFY